MAAPEHGHSDFHSRGGWWVVAQVPLLLLAMLLPWWSSSGAPATAQWLAGWGLLLAGFVLIMATASRLGRHLTPFPEPLPRSVLRTDGIYARVRHPMYAGILCMALGWALVNHSLPGVLLVPALFVFFDRKAAHEERSLCRRFPQYPAYRQRVRKLIPWIY